MVSLTGSQTKYYDERGSILKRCTPLFFLLTLLLIAAFLLWPEKCLAVESGGRLLFACPISEGDKFEVGFTHSLNLSPVTDVIEWTGDEMILRKSTYKTFGAGIPLPSDGIGTELVRLDGYYELRGIDLHLKSFTIMTQTIAQHHIIFKGYEIDLIKLAGSGKAVSITVKRVSRIKWS